MSRKFTKTHVLPIRLRTELVYTTDKKLNSHRNRNLAINDVVPEVTDNILIYLDKKNTDIYLAICPLRLVCLAMHYVND